MAINLSVKNVPDSVAKRVRERARRNHRSLQGELLAILEETLMPRRISSQEAFERIVQMGFKTGPESAQMIREDRDNR